MPDSSFFGSSFHRVSFIRNAGFTGTVAVAAFVVIAAVIVPIMRMTTLLGTVFYSADRAVCVFRCLIVMTAIFMMSVSGNRHAKENGY